MFRDLLLAVVDEEVTVIALEVPVYVCVNVPVPEVIAKFDPASSVKAAKVVAPSAFRVEEVEIAPSEVIAPIPVIAPVVPISQSPVSMAKVPEPPPMVMTFA